MLSEKYKRESEFKNTSLMNQIYDMALCSWDAKASPNDQNQIKLQDCSRQNQSWHGVRFFEMQCVQS